MKLNSAKENSEAVIGTKIKSTDINIEAVKNANTNNAELKREAEKSTAEKSTAVNNEQLTNTIRGWVKTASEIMALKIDKVPTLVDPIIPKYGAMSLAGSSDLGKSYLLLQLSDAIVHGDKDFLGFNLNVTHKSVICLSTEDDDYSICPRIIKMSEKRKNKTAYDNLRIIYETNSLTSRIDDLLKEKPADLVIIDTFTDIYDGDMNQANRVRNFIQKFKDLARKHKTLIIFNHHCGKKNDYRAPHKDNLLGSQGFESSMRTVIELRKDFDNPSLRHLCIVKGNYMDESHKNSSYVLDFNYENGFTNTGNRVSFDKLVKSDGKVHLSRDTAIIEKVTKLQESGLSMEKIAAKLTEEGIPISKSTVGNICKENCPTIQSPPGDKLDGQAA